MKNKTPTGGSAELRVKSCVLLAVLSGSLPTSFCSLLTRLFRPWLHVWQHFCLKRHSFPLCWHKCCTTKLLGSWPSWKILKIVVVTGLFFSWVEPWSGSQCSLCALVPASWGGAGVILVLRGTPGTLKDGWSLYRTLHTVSTRPCSYKWWNQLIKRTLNAVQGR